MPDVRVQTQVGMVVWCRTHRRPIIACQQALTQRGFDPDGWTPCEMLNASVVALLPPGSDDARPHRVGSFEGTD